MTDFYYDGDSFSCSLPTGQTKNTGHILSSRLGYDMKHYGFPGKAPSQIIRSAMRYSFDNKDAFMCIGIGAYYRLEYHSNEYIPINHPFDLHESEECIHPLRGETLSKMKLESVFSELFHWQYLETQLLFNLVALHDFLMYNNINFVIHNLGMNFSKFTKKNEFPFAAGVKAQIDDRPRILNFYKDSLHNLMLDKNIKGYDYNLYKEWAHPDEHGHAMYADYLWEEIHQYV